MPFKTDTTQRRNKLPFSVSRFRQYTKKEK